MRSAVKKCRFVQVRNPKSKDYIRIDTLKGERVMNKKRTRTIKKAPKTGKLDRDLVKSVIKEVSLNRKQEWELKSISDIDQYGIYRQGLDSQEIKKYLKIRARNTMFDKLTTKQLYSRFGKIAGVNTMALVTLPNGTVNSLMYRHDVLRFADCLFLNKPTFWD